MPEVTDTYVWVSAQSHPERRGQLLHVIVPARPGSDFCTVEFVEDKFQCVAARRLFRVHRGKWGRS